VVVSVTKFTGGTAHNVIPGRVEMLGTVRTLDPEVRKQVPELMERVVKGVTEAHGATYEFEYQFGYRPVINDEEVTRVIADTVRQVFDGETLEMVRPNMGGEDFSALQQKAPGTFFWVGARNEEKGITYPHHHPRFTIDEDALPYGVKMFLHATFRLMNDNAPRI
jgi:amidohydrolase